MTQGWTPPVAPQQRSLLPNQPLTVTLEAREWTVVLAGLAELPFKLSANVIGNLNQQLAIPEPATAQRRPEPVADHG